jgi:phage gp16-like protein
MAMSLLAPLDYAARLRAVRAELASAERAGRFAEAEALRLAEDVLCELLTEREQHRLRAV